MVCKEEGLRPPESDEDDGTVFLPFLLITPGPRSVSFYLFNNQYIINRYSLHTRYFLILYIYYCVHQKVAGSSIE